LRVALRRRTLRLSAPLRASYGPVHDRELLLLELTDAEGRVGRGEAAPLPAYDGVSVAHVERALQAYRAVLEDPGERRGPQLMDACRAIDDLPQALAAVDLALWDLAGQREGKPVAALLSDRPLDEVPVNATIGAADRATAAMAAGEAVAQGYRCLKLKVGLGDDAGRVAAVRAAAGPHVALRLDANGAWGVEEAVRMIQALAPAGLELVEEPTHGLRSVRAVRERVAVRVAIDETAGEAGALGAGVADAVCLKLSRCGGIGALLAAATLVRASGAEPYVASTFDGPIGIAAGVHAAAALAGHGPMPACGLATLSLFSERLDMLPVCDGAIAVPTGPGLGVGADWA
jgi:L-alanine-DL-glutamate epimerase-like enolase superfamily enzyme